MDVMVGVMTRSSVKGETGIEDWRSGKEMPLTASLEQMTVSLVLRSSCPSMDSMVMVSEGSSYVHVSALTSPVDQHVPPVATCTIYVVKQRLCTVGNMVVRVLSAWAPLLLSVKPTGASLLSGT
jgi:hypothetical protein